MAEMSVFDDADADDDDDCRQGISDQTSLGILR